MSVTQYVRGKVSKSKRRYVDKEGGYDLDLSYIVEKRIIAMGFPSEGMEAKYRNPYTEVIRFLEERHASHYKVYNLCSERGYDPIKFHNAVGIFPFDDHHPPPFELLHEFCMDVKTFLEEDPANVAVIHCKAGKGRTGTVICAYMLYEGLWETTDESMTFYAAMRTYNKKGVTIPSQVRYIRYYEQFLKYGMPPVPTLFVKQVILHGIPKVPTKMLLLEIMIDLKKIIHNQEMKAEKSKSKKKNDDELDTLIFECETPVELHGDIKMICSEKQNSFAWCFHTGWLASQWHPDGPFTLVLQQQVIDTALKDKNHKIYPKGFHIEVVFEFPDMNAVEQDKIYKKFTGGEGQEQEETAGDTKAKLRYSDLTYTYPSLNNY